MSKEQMLKVSEYSDRILEIIDSASEIPRGDLQGMVEAAVLDIVAGR